MKRNGPGAPSATAWHKKLKESSRVPQAGGLALPGAPASLVPVLGVSRGRSCRQGSPGLGVTSLWRRSAPGNLRGDGREQHSLCRQHRPRWAPSRAGEGTRSRADQRPRRRGELCPSVRSAARWDTASLKSSRHFITPLLHGFPGFSPRPLNPTQKHPHQGPRAHQHTENPDPASPGAPPSRQPSPARGFRSLLPSPPASDALQRWHFKVLS